MTPKCIYFMQGKTIFNAALTSNGFRALLSGGHTEFRTSSKEVFEYDFVKGFRKLSAELSSPRDGHVCILLPGFDEASVAISDPDEVANYSNLPSVMIVGANLETDSSSEIVRFKEEEDVSEVEDYPLVVEGPFGSDRIICGGKDFKAKMRSKDCYKLENGSWAKQADLPIGLSHSAALTVHEELWVFGGQSDRDIESTIWVFDGQEWEERGQMPRGLAEHCAVKVDEDTVLIIGGTVLNRQKLHD